MIFTRVDLPAPFSPSRAWISPGATAKSMRSLASTPGKRLLMPLASRRGASGWGTVMPRPHGARQPLRAGARWRSEEHTSELQSLMRISYAVFCLKKKNYVKHIHTLRLMYKHRNQSAQHEIILMLIH